MFTSSQNPPTLLCGSGTFSASTVFLKPRSAYQSSARCGCPLRPQACMRPEIYKTSMGMNPQWWGCRMIVSHQQLPTGFGCPRIVRRECLALLLPMINLFVRPLDLSKHWGSEPQVKILSLSESPSIISSIAKHVSCILMPYRQHHPSPPDMQRSVRVQLGAPAVVSLVIWLHPGLTRKVEKLWKNRALESGFILGLLSCNQTWPSNTPHLKLCNFAWNPIIRSCLIFRG